MKKILFSLLFIISFQIKSEILFEDYLKYDYKKIEHNLIVKKINKDIDYLKNKQLNIDINLLKKMNEICIELKLNNESLEINNLGLKISKSKLDIAYFKYYKAYILNRSSKIEEVISSLNIFNDVLNLLKEYNDKDSKKYKFDASLAIADTLSMNGDVTNAIYYYEEAEKNVFSDTNLLDIKTSRLFLYNSLELHKLAFTEMSEILNLLNIAEIPKKEKDSYYKLIYQFYAFIHEKEGNYKEANKYAIEYTKLLKENEDPADMIKGYFLISSTYSNLKQFDKAEEYFKKIEYLKLKYEAQYHKSVELYAKFSYFKNKEDYNEALKILDEYKENTKSKAIGRDYSFIYKKLGDYEKAYKYYEEYVEYMESKVKENEFDTYITGSQRRYSESMVNDIKRIKSENIIKNQELLKIQKDNENKEKTKKLLYFFIILSLLLAIIYISLYRKYYKRMITDGLTQILNKKYINMNRKKYEQFIIFDIDFFKKINDTYGHLAGDYVLVECAKIATRVIDKNGKVCRYGGEEFVVLLNKNVDGKFLAEKLRAEIEREVFKFENLEIKFTISVGVSNSIESADILLYKAKNSGRNKVMC